MIVSNTSLRSTVQVVCRLIGSMAVHHITEREIAGKPVFADTPDKDTLQNLLETYTLVAHNAAYDVDVLERTGVEVTTPICTLRLSRYLLPELEQHKLQYLRYYFGIEFAENLRLMMLSVMSSSSKKSSINSTNS